MLIKKREEVTKQGFCKIPLKKTPSWGSLLLVLGDGCLFEFDWGQERVEEGVEVGVVAHSRLGAH